MNPAYRPADRNLLVGTHLGLSTAVAATLFSVGLSWPFRLVLLVLLLAPLAACCKGVLRGHRRALTWLSLALVAYAGLGMVEIIATRSAASVAVLLFSLIELALVLRLLRYLPAQSPDAAKES